MPTKQRFDLMDLLRDTQPKTKQKALTPFVRNDRIKREYGRRLVNEIEKNTLRGRDKNDKSMTANTPYSKAYKESLEFKVHGKTSRVNMRLSGQMLASMAVTSTDATSVTIGFLSKEQEKKARRHINGVGKLPVRDFFGLPKKDQIRIFKTVVRDFNLEEEAQTLEGALEALGGEITIEGETVSDDLLIQQLVLDFSEEDNG
jgi:hypothetical protein